MVNWQELEAEYVTGDTSYEKLSKEHHINRTTIGRYAKEHGWTSKRQAFRDETLKNNIQKTVEKLSDVQSDIASLQARSAVLIAEQINKFLSDGVEEPMDLLRITNSWNIMQAGIRAGETAEEIVSGICFLPARDKGND